MLDLISGVNQRIYPVGRLDYNTSGVLLLTNDGAMTQALSHPKSGVPRIYRTKVDGQVKKEHIQALRDGVMLSDGKVAKGYDVFVLSATDTSTTVQITLKEGRNHQIHRMVEAIGHKVNRLARTRFAGIDVEGLAVGKWRRLTGRELGRLKRDYLNKR